MYVDPHAGTFKPLTAPSPHHMMHPSQSTSALHHVNHVGVAQGVSRSSSGSNLRTPGGGPPVPVPNNHVYQDSESLMSPYTHRMRPQPHHPQQHHPQDPRQHIQPSPQHHRVDSGDSGGHSSRPTSAHHREVSDGGYHRGGQHLDSGYQSSRSSSTKSSRSYHQIQNPNNLNRNNVGQMSQRSISPNSQQRRMLPDPTNGQGSGRNSPSVMSRRHHVPIDEQSPMLHRIQSNNWGNEPPQRPIPVRQFYDERSGQYKVQGGVAAPHHGSMSSLHQPQERHAAHERNTRAGRSLDGSDPSASQYALLSSCSSGAAGDHPGPPPPPVNSKRMHQAVHAAHSGGRNSPKMGTQSTGGSSGGSRGSSRGHPQQQQPHPQQQPPNTNRIPGTSFSSSFH